MRKPIIFGYGIFQFVAMIAVTTCLQAIAAAQTQSQDSKTAYTVAGTVLLSDEQPSSNALIRFRDGMGNWDQTIADKQGRFQFSLNCRPSAIVYIYAADRSEVFWMEFRNNNISERVKRPLDIKLVPAISIPVLVQQSGLPIKDASVVGRTKEFGWNFAPEKTDAKGKTEIVIPAAHQLDQVWAIESKTGLGGLSGFANGSNGVVKIELMPSKKKKALVLDEQDKPVANIRVKANLSCQDKSKVTGQLPELFSVTDEDGYATFDWMPEDSHWGIRVGVYENAEYTWNSSKKAERNQPFISGPYRDLRLLYVNAIPQKILVSGIIKGVDGSISDVKVGGYGMGPSGQSDLPSSVSDENGNFSLKLIPGLTYIVGITDDKLACDLVEMKVNTDGVQTDPLVLQTYPAIPLTIKVTQGRNKRPLSNVSVQHFQTKSIQLAPGYEGRPSLAQGKVLDEHGVAVFGSSAGKIQVNLGIQKWGAHKFVDVVKDEPMTIEFHAPAIGTRKVTGAIVAPPTELSRQMAKLDSRQKRLEGRNEVEHSKAIKKKAFLADQIRKHNEKHAGNCAISIFNPFGDPRHAVTKTDKDGSWSVDLDTNLICVHAVSSDGNYSAFRTYREVGEEVGQLKLKPSVKVSGRLISPDGTPLANREIFLTRAVPRDFLPLPVHFTSVKTDDEGRFEFPSVITNFEQKISIRTHAGNIQNLTRTTTYKPGEEVTDLEVIYQERIARPLRLPNK